MLKGKSGGWWKRGGCRKLLIYFLLFVVYLSLQQVLQTSLPYSVPWKSIYLISPFRLFVLLLMVAFKE